MNEKLEYLSGSEKIKYFLESTCIHYTATEIYDFFSAYKIESSKKTPFIKSSIRTYLKDLATTREIQVQEIPKRRENYYLALRSDKEESITINLVGLWLQHYNDEYLQECVKEKLYNPNIPYSSTKYKDDIETPDDSEMQEDLLSSEDRLKNVAFFQGIGMMNYYDIPKVGGINPFRRIEGEPAQGVQRPRDRSWIEELEYGLNSKYSALLTSTILYFPINQIEKLEIGARKDRDDNLIECKIKIPYFKHSIDDDKPGIVLDGQQRMWALDFINLRRVFYEGKEPTQFYGPVTVIIGDFRVEPDYETSIIRMYFVNSNNTRNLPPKLTQQISGEIKNELRRHLPGRDQFKGNIESMVSVLDTEPISPFHQIIDHDKLRFDKIGDIKEINGTEVRMFSRVAIVDTIIDLVKLRPFSIDPKKPKEILKLDVNHGEWAKLIIDYYNAFKSVFYSDWEDVDSLIKRNIGIYALGLMFPHIWTYNFNPLSRDKRVRSFISLLAKWKDFDSDLDFRGTSGMSSRFTGEKKELAKSLTGDLEKRWITCTEETGYSDDAELIKEKAEAKWEEIKIDAGIVGEDF